MYNDLVICLSDALDRDQDVNIIHQKVYVDPDPVLDLLELESQNIVVIVALPPNKEIRGMQLLASTSTLSPFPDLGTRTWEGTLLTYGSGRVVCTGHKTVHEAIVNINSLTRTLANELKQPLYINKGEITNVVASGRINFQLCREKLRQQPGAYFSKKFDGTIFNTKRENGKDIRVSIFQSGRFNMPGLYSMEEAKTAFLQVYAIINHCRMDHKTVPARLNRNTSRKRRKVREW
jgi:TATA-box binding protein (TBP) (component of TFIID and TFIIIB)